MFMMGGVESNNPKSDPTIVQPVRVRTFSQPRRTNGRSSKDERTLNMNEKMRGFSFVRERMKDRNEISKNRSWKNQTWTTHERIRSWTMNDRSSVPKWRSRTDSEKIRSCFVHVSFIFQTRSRDSNTQITGTRSISREYTTRFRHWHQSDCHW